MALADIVAAVTERYLAAQAAGGPVLPADGWRGRYSRPARPAAPTLRDTSERRS